MGLIIDTLVSDLSSSLLGRIKTISRMMPGYETVSKSINYDSMQSDIKQIIETSFSNVSSIPSFENTPQKILRESIFANSDILIEWLFNEPMPEFVSEKITIADDSYSDKIIQLFKSFHEQFKINRTTYVSFSTEHIKAILKTHSEQMGMIHDNTKTTLSITSQILTNQETRLNLSFSKELEEIKTEIEDRNYRKAEAALKSLEDTILITGNDADKEKLYELFANLYLGDTKNQIRTGPYLEKLIKYTTNGLKRKERQALLLILNKDYLSANGIINTTLSDDLADNDKYYLRNLQLNLFLLTQQYDKAKIHLEVDDKNYDQLRAWQIRYLLAQGLYSDAKTIIIKDEEYFQKNFDLRILRIEALTYDITSNCHQNGFKIEYIEIVTSLINECTDLQRLVFDDYTSNEKILVCKSLLYLVIHKNSEAITVFRKLEEINSTEQNFLQNYPFTLLRIGEYKTALEYFKKCLNTNPGNKHMLEAYYYTLIMTDPSSAVNELEKFKESDDTLRIKLLLFSVYIKNIIDLPKAKKLLDEMENKYPDNTTVNSIKGDYFIYIKQEGEALSCYIKAIEKPYNEMHRRELLGKIIAIYLYQKTPQSILESIKLIETISNEYELLEAFGYQYIYALISNNEIPSAIKVIKKIHEYQLITPEILRQEIWCNYNSLNFQRVVDLSEELNKENKLSQKDLLVYIRSLFALGKTDYFRDVIQNLPEPETEQDFFTLWSQAKLTGLKDKAIEIAHKGFLKFPENISVMECFVESTLLGGTSSIPVNIYTDVLTCRKKYFSLSDKLRRIQQISIPSDATGEDILAILKQYVPESTHIDYQGVINKNRMHISFCTINGYNLFEVWECSHNIESLPIYCSSGRFDMLEKENKALEEQRAILDLPSLITCAYLDILDYLPEVLQTIYVSQQSITELNNFLHKVNDPLSGNLLQTFYQLNNQMYPSTSISLTTVITLAENIRSFIDRNGVRIVGKQLIPQEKLPDKLAGFLAKGNILEQDTITYSFESNIPIMLECFIYRELLSLYENAPPAFGIESILYKMQITNTISEIRYIYLVSRLLQAKYQCIIFNHFMLFRIVEYYGFQNTDIVQSFINALSNQKIYNSRHVLALLLLFLCTIWNSIIPWNIKGKWTDIVLQCLIKRNDISFNQIQFFCRYLLQTIKTRQNEEWFTDYYNKTIKQLKEQFDETTSL